MIRILRNSVFSSGFILLLICFWNINVLGQDLKDTLSMGPDSIPMPSVIPYNQILIQAGESQIRSVRISETLIPLESIAAENVRNDSILSLIDSALAPAKTIDYRLQNQRYLQNEKFYWESAKKHADDQRKRLSTLIMELQDHQGKLEQEFYQWKQTRDFSDSTMATTNIMSVIDSSLSRISGLEKEIEERTALLINPLDKTVNTEMELALLLGRIQEALTEKTSLGLLQSTTGIFKRQDSASGYSPGIREVPEILRSEWTALGFYLEQQKTASILFLLFVALMLVLFIWMSTRLKSVERPDLTYYEANLVRILHRPVTCALLFSLFFSVAFFPERPPLLRDLTIMVLLLPILDLGIRLIPTQRKILLWGFVAAQLMVLFLKIVPSESQFHLSVSMGLLLLELLVLIYFYRNPGILVLATKTLSRFIRFLVILHLVVVSAGIIAVLMGYQNIAIIAMESLVNNVLLGLLLYICAIILVGALHFLISSQYLENLNFVQQYKTYLRSLVSRLVIIGVTLFWIDAILRIFYLKNAVYSSISESFTHAISIGSFSFTLGGIFTFIIVIWLSIVFSRVVKIILKGDVLDRLSLKKGVPRMITAITQFALITFGFLLAVRSIGMPLDQLTIIFSAFSLGIGFGLQNIFNNLVSGVILLFEREVQIGDIIEVNNVMGTVQSMGIRSSHIRTFEGAEVIVPNGMLISQEVIDWTLSDKSRRIEIISGVAYGSDVHRVRELLMKVIMEHPDVKKQPEPLVLFNAMGESSLDFRLLFWTDQFDQWLRIRSEVIFGIHDILYENNISIPFPQRDLHIKSGLPGWFGPEEAPGT